MDNPLGGTTQFLTFNDFKMKKTILLSIAILALSLGSCTRQVMNFTTLSNASTNLQFQKSQGKKTTGKHLTFLGFNSSITEATQEALEKAGPDYDLLIDGQIGISDYFFVYGFVVEGTAVSSRNLISQLGQEGFEQFLAEHEIVGQDVINNKSKEYNRIVN